jgi:hypothetical protein
MRALVSKFERPHNRIHAIAAHVTEAADAGNIEEAKAVIASCRETDLAEMIGIFTIVKEQYVSNQRETTIVFRNEGQYRSIAVDSVLTVENIRPFDNEPDKQNFLNINGSGLIYSLAKQSRCDDVIFVVNHEKLLE